MEFQADQVIKAAHKLAPRLAYEINPGVVEFPLHSCTIRVDKTGVEVYTGRWTCVQAQTIDRWPVGTYGLKEGIRRAIEEAGVRSRRLAQAYQQDSEVLGG